VIVVKDDPHPIQFDRLVFLHRESDLMTRGPSCRHTQSCSGDQTVKELKELTTKSLTDPTRQHGGYSLRAPHRTSWLGWAITRY